MPFDEQLAQRVRKLMARKKSFVEKKMFGGVGFLLGGNMCVGVWKDSLIVRIGREAYETALAEFEVGEFDITGKPMTGWVMVRPPAIEEDDQFHAWIGRAVSFVKTLPAK